MNEAAYTRGLHVQLACIWEATARKAGNVHPGRDFADAGHVDFLTAAAALGPVLGEPSGPTLGATVLEAVRRCRRVARGNVNLGIVLLLAPLARAAAAGDPRRDLPAVLDAVDVADTARVYEAIRLAQPGGLGRADAQDVAAAPTLPLRQVMALAAHRDFIARQYANGFRDVFDEVAPRLREGLTRFGSLEGAIQWAQLRLLAEHSDSLIARKRGAEEAAEARRRAQDVVRAGWPETEAGRAALADLDAWLRGVGHQRNPGTTADLIAAGLFVLLTDGAIPLPCPWGLEGPGA